MTWRLSEHQRREIAVKGSQARWAGPIGHVHHKNEDVTDNTPENLEVVTALEHKSRHLKWDVDKAIELYNSGWSYPRLGKLFDRDASSMLRRLRNRGVVSRPVGRYARP